MGVCIREDDKHTTYESVFSETGSPVMHTTAATEKPAAIFPISAKHWRKLSSSTSCWRIVLSYPVNTKLSRSISQFICPQTAEQPFCYTPSNDSFSRHHIWWLCVLFYLRWPFKQTALSNLHTQTNNIRFGVFTQVAVIDSVRKRTLLVQLHPVLIILKSMYRMLAFLHSDVEIILQWE